MDKAKLTKPAQAVIIGTFISMLGRDLVNERIDKKKLESVIPIFNELEDIQRQSEKFDNWVFRFCCTGHY
ncbi:hypothetical protein P4523_11760 [Bacillus toyonensis]|uniref:hypothetical protein n=1 Tax=Bacillus toyonensis TaxID=155322 RepID=UPI002E1BCAB0|nr:hypothetical protein [Bacillus toyonensis]